MELNRVFEMKNYIDKKFSSPQYTAKSLPVAQRRKNPDYTVFEIKYYDFKGTYLPEFTGRIRCYKNGVTSVE